jgi:hypothetical protein
MSARSRFAFTYGMTVGIAEISTCTCSAHQILKDGASAFIWHMDHFDAGEIFQELRS